MVAPDVCGYLQNSIAAIDSLLQEAGNSAAFIENAINSLLILQNTLCRKVKVLKRQKAFLEQSFAAIQLNIQTQSKTVRVNLRGKVFEIERRSLVKHWGTYFSHMLLAAPHQEMFFVDRSHEGFELVLAYMGCHGSYLSIEDLDNADYYNMDCADDDLRFYNLLSKNKSIDLSYAISDIRISCASVLPRDRSICCGTFDGILKIIPMSSFRKPTQFAGHRGAIANLVELNDGRVCSISEDCTLRVWDLEQRCCVAVMNYERPFRSVFEKKDPFCNHLNCNFIHELQENKVLFIVGNTIRMWDIVDGVSETVLSPSFESQPHPQRISRAVYLQNGLIAIVCRPFDDTLQVWSLMNANCIMSARAPPFLPITALAKGGNHQVHTADEHCIRSWDVNSGQCIMTYHIRDHISSLLFMPSGGRLFSIGQLRNEQSTCAVFSIETHGESKPMALIEYPDSSIRSAIQLQDYNLLLFTDGSIRVWRP